jgi:hypothetical protein
MTQSAVREFLDNVRRMHVAASIVAGASLLLPAAPAMAQQSAAQLRSVTDVRPRIPDEHDRPYFRETQSHRGWEIREPQFIVFAATSAEDARAAAAHVSQSWKQAAALAGRWTDVPSQPDFGLSALQVVIDNEPLRSRDAPPTTVNVVGLRTQVQINLGPGQPRLEQQLLQVREGAAFAALHAAGVDSAAPPWVVAGLAAHAGRAGLTPEQLKQYSPPAGAAHFAGQQWRFERSANDLLDYRRLDHQEATGQVAFLLTGDDAEHAPAFLQALHETTVSAAARAADGDVLQSFPGNPRPAANGTPCDQLLNGLAAAYAAWKQNPVAGQPVYEPTKNASPELLAAEGQMLVLLKLHKRMSASAKAQGGGVRTKVVTFDRTKGAAVAPHLQESPPSSFAAFAARLTDAAQPAWGTLDVDGSLLLSTDHQRVNELVGGFDQRYTLERHNDRTVLVRRLEGERMLRGWLGENPKDKTRPLAKFEVVDLRGKAKVERVGDEQRQARSRRAGTPRLKPAGDDPIGERRAEPVEPDQQPAAGRENDLVATRGHRGD